MTEFHNRYLTALHDRVLVYDGAMGTSLQRYNLTASDFGGEKLWGCNDHLVLSKPPTIRALREALARFSAGAGRIS